MTEEHDVEQGPYPDQPPGIESAPPESAPAEPTVEAAPRTGDATVEAAPRTGDATVDAALSTLDRLEQLGVEEHLPLFEQAHDALRRALNRPPEAAGSGS